MLACLSWRLTVQLLNVVNRLNVEEWKKARVFRNERKAKSVRPHRKRLKLGERKETLSVLFPRGTITTCVRFPSFKVFFSSQKFLFGADDSLNMFHNDLC